jgi:hypothetical protein
MKRSSRLVLALLVSFATDGRCTGTHHAVVEGLSGKAHYRVQREQEQLDTAVGGGGAEFARIRAEFDAVLDTSLAVARDLHTAFAMAVTLGQVEDSAAGLFNTAVDATLALVSRLEELLATSVDAPTGELGHYQRELDAVRSQLADRKGRIKKLGGPGRTLR